MAYDETLDPTAMDRTTMIPRYEEDAASAGFMSGAVRYEHELDPSEITGEIPAITDDMPDPREKSGPRMTVAPPVDTMQQTSVMERPDVKPWSNDPVDPITKLPIPGEYGDHGIVSHNGMLFYAPYDENGAYDVAKTVPIRALPGAQAASAGKPAHDTVFKFEVRSNHPDALRQISHVIGGQAAPAMHPFMPGMPMMPGPGAYPGMAMPLPPAAHPGAAVPAPANLQKSASTAAARHEDTRSLDYDDEPDQTETRKQHKPASKEALKWAGGLVAALWIGTTIGNNLIPGASHVTKDIPLVGHVFDTAPWDLSINPIHNLHF